jgi:hypothetical protein
MHFCSFILYLTWACRVEGNTILIASSIPVLWPLVQLVLRCKPFNSGTERDSNCDTDNTAGAELMQCKSKLKPKPKADLGTTINDGGESEEDILSPVDTRAVASCAGSVSHPPDGRILRTDIGTDYI